MGVRSIIAKVVIRKFLEGVRDARRDFVKLVV